MVDNRCVSCGDIIPEGIEICWACEHGHTPDKIKEKKEKENDGEV